MEALKYGDPDRPDEDRTTCEDNDWNSEAESEQEELVSEVARQFITNPV
jgi:hypothetical protein